MSVLAIIPARGGSKRIPGKNIKLFMGKPMIAYAIEAALKSGVFDEVMVSTDSEEIAAIAREYGASVPFMRSAETATDKAPTRAVLEEVIHKYKELGKEFEYFSCIYSNPFVRAEVLKAAYEQFVNSNACQMYAVVPFSYPPQRGFYNIGGRLKFVQPEYIYTNSQDLPIIYHDVGQFYFHRTERFLLNPPVEQKFIMPFVMNESEIQDMDSPEDWKMAQIKYRLLHEND